MQKIKKNILHLTHTDIRCDSRILKEIKALDQANYNVFGIGAELDENAKSENTKSIKVTTVKLACRSLKILPKPYRHLLTLLEFLCKLLPLSCKFKPDLIHCHDTIALVLGIFLKPLTGSKVVYDAHELESDRNGLSKKLGKVIFGFEKIVWKCIDGFITVSPSILKWYLKNLGQKKSEIILNSPEIKKRKPNRNKDLRKKFGIPQTKKIFLYNGIIGPGRSIKTLLQVFQDPKIKSHIVFLGYGDWVSYIKEAQRNNSKIHYHKPVSHSEVVSLTTAADFGLCLIEKVSLSDFFCLPNKLFEYIFAGLPVLASKFPDIEKLVKEYDLGTVCEINIKNILAQVQKLENKNSRKKIKSLKKLSWLQQKRKLLNFYERVIR
jgi:glycosyltransferase involved in cell wall biosynthesis